jgi:hypothetical protein
MCMCVNRLNRKLISQATVLFQHLFVAGSSGDAFREPNERFECELSLRFLRCAYLDKRIAGLNDIKEYIELSEKKEEWRRKNKGGLFNSAMNMMAGQREEPVPPYVKLWVTTDFMAKFCADHKVLSCAVRLRCAVLRLQ